VPTELVKNEVRKSSDEEEALHDMLLLIADCFADVEVIYKWQHTLIRVLAAVLFLFSIIGRLVSVAGDPTAVRYSSLQ
jgi:hypothetical protein